MPSCAIVRRNYDSVAKFTRSVGINKDDLEDFEFARGISSSSSRSNRRVKFLVIIYRVPRSSAVIVAVLPAWAYEHREP